MIAPALAVGLGACGKDHTPDQKPTRSDLEHHNHAQPRARRAASATASAAPTMSGARLAAPLAVQPLPDVCSISDRIENLAAGEQVLVSPIRVNFVLATVVEPSRGQEVLVASRHGNEFVAPAERVYGLRPSRSSRAEANCYGACKPASEWIPCLVTRAQGSRIVARDRDGRELYVQRSEVVVFDPAVQRHVRAFLEEANYERAFRAQVHRSGRIRQPSGFRCAEGDVVLAAFGEKYLICQITAATQQSCTVKWLGSSMAPAVRDVSQVVPLPNGYNQPPRLSPGDFVLGHARGRLSPKAVSLDSGSEDVQRRLPDVLWAEWEPHRVEAVYPDGRLVLSDAQHKSHPDVSGEVVPYERPSAPAGGVKPAEP